jgi:molecular chaperone GrpE
MRETNNELNDQYIRAKAETDNTRRISAKEVEKARKFALESFAKELLQVKDSLDQAAQVDLKSNVTEQLIEQMSEGLALTLKQLGDVFERFKIEVVNPEAGDVLDPELHQAMTRQPSDEVDTNNIVSTLQTGYTLNGRLLRPAMVIVSSGS